MKPTLTSVLEQDNENDSPNVKGDKGIVRNLDTKFNEKQYIKDVTKDNHINRNGHSTESYDSNDKKSTENSKYKISSDSHNKMDSIERSSNTRTVTDPPDESTRKIKARKKKKRKNKILTKLISTDQGKFETKGNETPPFLAKLRIAVVDAKKKHIRNFEDMRSSVCSNTKSEMNWSPTSSMTSGRKSLTSTYSVSSEKTFRLPRYNF